MTADLFYAPETPQIRLASHAVYLPRFALPVATQCCQILKQHFERYPPLQMMTPMGYQMSVRSTSFGKLGWLGSKQGYGYTRAHPLTNKPWPSMPDTLLNLAKGAAAQAGFNSFTPDTCLVNVYEIGSKMGLHQDKDEQDFSQPIVSVSLGLPVTFQFGGPARGDKVVKLPLMHGDVVVWGADNRLCFHGVLPLKAGNHPLLGKTRINLTFRKAGKM